MQDEGNPQGSAGAATATPDQPATGATPQGLRIPGATPTPTPPATGNQQAGSGQQQAAGSEDLSSLPEGVQTLIRNLRRTEQTLGNKLKGYEQANLTDIEKRDTRIKELETELGTVKGTLTDLQLQGVFSQAAAKAGAVDPDLLYQVSKASITLDGEGKPTNLDAVIDGLKKTRPNQFKRGSIDGGAGGGQSGQSGTSMNSMLRGMAGKGR